VPWEISGGHVPGALLKEGIFDRQFPTLLKKRKQNGVCVLLQNRAALKSIALGLLSFKNHTFREMTSSN
jgi:hypothetical protein